MSEDSPEAVKPPAKKCKTSGNSNQNELSILCSHILRSADKQVEAFQNARPFPHGRLENVFQPDFLKDAFEEVKQNSKVKFKESDLFRVYQSVDLGNLSGNDATTFPFLSKLKAAIYSSTFRSFMERINGLSSGTLTTQVDCAANCHAEGCHLLCHDDVIGTRKVSFILYLTESGWTEEEGGSLELYESEDTVPPVPKPTPSSKILPVFNSLAYFVVEPGKSFHSVQEVFGERPRLSIQGWYHAKETPDKMEDATLNRLKSEQDDTEGDFVLMESSTGCASSLTDDDRTFLSKFINPTYLSKESGDEIRERFEEDSSVQLCDFLRPEYMKSINKRIAVGDKGVGSGKPALDYSIGVSDVWKLVGPAHKQRFLEYEAKTEADDGDIGAILANLKDEVLQSPAFGRFLQSLTSLDRPTGHRGRIRRFRPGLDYTVAHYGILTKEAVLDATLCFVNDGNNVWESGDIGGFECYVSADEDDGSAGAADEYDEEDDTELLSVSASNNTLSLVYRDPGTMRFVKYVGCRAPSSRWDVSMEYQLPPGDDH